MLAVIIARTKENGQIKGVVSHLVEDDLSILQFWDDTLPFYKDHDIGLAMNMKLLLCTLSNSGLKINFHKSGIFYFKPAKECGLQYSQLFGCKLGTYPFRYLSIPMHYRELNNKD
jgi:hypothetical protein